VTGPAQNRLNEIYRAQELDTALRYGSEYDFRIRLRDLSGGGAESDAKPENESPSSIGRCRFKRYVAPNQPRVVDLPVSTDAPSEPDSITIERPLLGYPAAVYTGSYADAVTLLKNASRAMNLRPPAEREAFGIPDPDVDRIEISVEVETLTLDNLESLSGKESYVHLYTTTRSFPRVVVEADFAAALTVPIEYRDVKVLHTGDEANLAVDFDFVGNIAELDAIFLPTGRAVRLTFRAVCRERPDAADYYGRLAPDGHPEDDSRFGHPVHLRIYRASHDERELFVASAAAQRLRGIYLQPDEPLVADGKITSLFFGREIPRPPDIVQRLAQELELESARLTLMPKKGERAQFGCSSRIRHTLAPDNSSLTFSAKTELAQHWLCCVNLLIDRDWMWDALDGRSFVVERTSRFTHDATSEAETQIVGEIELKRTASFESLHEPKRSYTRVVFIDAVEPKNPRRRPAPHDEPRFPDTLEVSYRIRTRFKTGHATHRDDEESLEISLPITTPPAQVPRIASAGLALSPYVRNDKYSRSEPRRRCLWIEFAEPVKDPQDTYFARLLAYGPDQLLSDNRPELLVAREDPPLPIDPEPVRVVVQGATNDLSGSTAMQPMEKAADSDVHYLLPLPPGLHANADEMFGFFTYEFRVGHYQDIREELEAKRMVWTTAQGRFGRALRATGIQHPAPALTCTASRDEKKLWVVAPYASAVFDGKNVTADPPRSALFCLLYAQARQADNRDTRNILLDDKQLDWRLEVEDEQERDPFLAYGDRERQTLKNLTVRSFKDAKSYAKGATIYKLAERSRANRDAVRYGTVAWTNAEVDQLLSQFGLPTDSSLSVLVVEFLPVITKFCEAVSGMDRHDVNASPIGTFSQPEALLAKELAACFAEVAAQRDRDTTSPLSDRLGERRILRTSPLTEVPFVCCPV
jgi:hypothetical protein